MSTVVKYYSIQNTLGNPLFCLQASGITTLLPREDTSSNLESQKNNWVVAVRLVEGLSL